MQVRPKDRVHEALERHRRVGQAEWHDQKLEVPMMRAEGRLLDVICVHLDLMVARTEIQLGEKFGAFEFIQELLYHWNGEFVLDYAIVEGAIIHTKALGGV